MRHGAAEVRGASGFRGLQASCWDADNWASQVKKVSGEMTVTTFQDTMEEAADGDCAFYDGLDVRVFLCDERLGPYVIWVFV